MLCGVRGATTVTADTPEALKEALTELFSAISERNNIREEDVVSVFLTVTPDIHSVSPGKILREQHGWHHVPIMCALEADIHGLPDMCVRVLVQFESTMVRSAVKPVYMRGAATLRPDLSAN